jgi:hypothetical protein
MMTGDWKEAKRLLDEAMLLPEEPLRLERSVGTGFACWPFFLKDPCLQNLRGLSEFESLISSLQAKYPDHLGLL